MSDAEGDPDEVRGRTSGPGRDPRFAALGARLAKVQGADAAKVTRDRRDAPRSPALGLAFRLSAELAAGVGFGVLSGWWLDRLLGTAPLLLIALTLLGGAGGLWSVIRTAGRMHRLQQDEDMSAKREERASGG